MSITSRVVIGVLGIILFAAGWGLLGNDEPDTVICQTTGGTTTCERG